MKYKINGLCYLIYTVIILSLQYIFFLVYFRDYITEGVLKENPDFNQFDSVFKTFSSHQNNSLISII